MATHKKITAKQFGGTRWIDFPGAEHTIPWVSFSSVYDPKKYGPPEGHTNPLPADYFRGKVVFVGETQLSLEDFHSTSTDPQMAGVEIEADATATILNHFPLSSVPGWINVVLIVLFARRHPADQPPGPAGHLDWDRGRPGAPVRPGRAAPVQRRLDRLVRLSAGRPDPEQRRLARGAARHRGVRAHPDR